jgi:hypothetical protein
MSKPLKADCIPVLFDVTCPSCKGDLHAPSGSVYWDREELNGSTVTCMGCGALVKLPKKS